MRRIEWVPYEDQRPATNGMYFWKGKSGHGGYSLYRDGEGFEFPEDTPVNKVSESNLLWLKETTDPPVEERFNQKPLTPRTK